MESEIILSYLLVGVLSIVGPNSEELLSRLTTEQV